MPAENVQSEEAPVTNVEEEREPERSEKIEEGVTDEPNEGGSNVPENNTDIKQPEYELLEERQVVDSQVETAPAPLAPPKKM